MTIWCQALFVIYQFYKNRVFDSIWWSCLWSSSLGIGTLKEVKQFKVTFLSPSIHTPFSDLTQSHGFKFCLYMLMTQMHLSTPGFPFSLVYVNVADQTIHFFTQSTIPLVFLILKKKKKKLFYQLLEQNNFSYSSLFPS